MCKYISSILDQINFSDLNERHILFTQIDANDYITKQN